MALKLIGNIVLKGMEIFSDERRRSLSKEYREIQEEIVNAKSARHPHYSDDRIAKAIQAEEIFLKAYYTEFSAAIDAVRSKDV